MNLRILRKFSESLAEFQSLRSLTMMAMLLFTACSQEGTSGSSSNQDSSTQSITVAVQVIKDGEHLVDTTIVLEGKNPTAGEAFQQACQNGKMAYTVTDGMYDGFAGYNSTETDGWLFYHNGQLADKGADDTAVSDRDTVTFLYVNYDEAFGSASSSEGESSSADSSLAA